jgi:PEGA domain
LTAAKRTYLKTQADARDTGETEITQRVSSSLAALELVMPKVVLRVAAAPGGAALTLDGVPIGATAEPIEVDPGEHRVVATATGHQPFERTFEISPRERKEILVELKREPVADAPRTAETAQGSAPDRDASWSPPPLPVWILAGAGVAATAAGLIVRIEGKSDYDQAVNDGCAGGKICPTQGAADSGNGARDRMIVGSVVAGVGGLAIVGAGVWWGLSAGSARHPSGGSVSARVSPSADGCSLLVKGNF